MPELTPEERFAQDSAEVERQWREIAKPAWDALCQAFPFSLDVEDQDA